MTTAEAMDRRGLGGLVVLCAAALVALSGCATIRAHEAASTERLLAAAGFQMRPADSPERLQDLATMPPFKVVSRSKDGNVVYTFADRVVMVKDPHGQPLECVCIEATLSTCFSPGP